jgi:hypothetical protein
LGGALPSTAVIEVSFGKTPQRIADFPIDLDRRWTSYPLSNPLRGD